MFFRSEFPRLKRERVNVNTKYARKGSTGEVVEIVSCGNCSDGLSRE